MTCYVSVQRNLSNLSYVMKVRARVYRNAYVLDIKQMSLMCVWGIPLKTSDLNLLIRQLLQNNS